MATVWSAAVLTGVVVLWRYANTPARAIEPPAHWPANSQMTLNPDGPTLLLFVHPKCPCTRASIAELARIRAKAVERFTGYAVVFEPPDADSSWQQTDLVHRAEEIPGVHLVFDPDGKLAQTFHVITSGHALLYDSAGELLFSGGITLSRGHEGENVGKSAIVSLLTGGQASVERAAVFGCPIVEDRN
ncbi:MAG: hypothetical protein IT427_10370 [Pirellulales bacterium]|nr:hypothetical protein [Pirellulales bacterium]